MCFIHRYFHISIDNAYKYINIGTHMSHMCRFFCVRYVCKSRNDGNMTPGDLETHTGWIRCGFYGQRNIKWPFGDSFYMFLLSTSHLWVLIIYIYINLIIGDCLLSGCIIIFCLPHNNISLSTNQYLSWSRWKGCILHQPRSGECHRCCEHSY